MTFALQLTFLSLFSLLPLSRYCLLVPTTDATISLDLSFSLCQPSLSLSPPDRTTPTPDGHPRRTSNSVALAVELLLL